MVKMVLVDANVLLEVFLSRDHCQEAKSVLISKKDNRLTVSILSTSIFMYYVEAKNQSKAKARTFLDNYMVLNMEQSDVDWAHANDVGDWEDALQTACALRHGCKEIVTLDNDFEKMYSSYIKVQTIV